MFLDGLEDAYERGRLMGEFAEECADLYQFTRDEQDAFAISSVRKARNAQSSGAFLNEIVPITFVFRGVTQFVDCDEQPTRSRIEKIPELNPAFRKKGTVTAANSSSISDGAAALVLASEGAATSHGLPIRARIVGHASFAQAPGKFTTAPSFAVRNLLKQISWNSNDVDLWEVNEAFAVVTIAFLRDMDIPGERMNVHGGACALGHPIGASGARIITTLLHALERHEKRRGVAAICIGGGEATAIAIERPQDQM